MISVGIDVAKGKSTICILKPCGKVMMQPKEFQHTKSDLETLVTKLKSFDEELHVVMEATGNYHLPVASYLKDAGYHVSIVNPLEMKRYRCQGIRNPKTDNIDAVNIAQYGLDNWFHPLRSFEMEEIRTELKLLGTQYSSFMKTRQERCLALCHIMDRTMPGIYGILDDFNNYNGRDKQSDFVYDFYHAERITRYSENPQR